jgi:uncharacterized membrane protein
MQSETARTETFSDGVFAIAITLLILEVKVPRHVPEGGLAAALFDLWPSYLAFVTSFVTIGVMWVNHHRLFTLIRRSDNGLLMTNLLLLLGVTWVPFPTALLAEYVGHPGDRVAAVVYSASFFVIAIFFQILWRYATGRGRLLGDDYDRDMVEWITRQYTPGPLAYVVALAVGLFNATASLLLNMLLALFFALPPTVMRRSQ